MTLRTIFPALLTPVVCLFSVSGCGGGPNNASGGNSPVYAAPAISGLSPSSIAAGALGVTLTVAGANFVQGSEIEWNGAAMPTLYVSEGSLQTSLTTTQLATAGTIQVGVLNPGSAGGATSNSMPLVISGSLTPNPLPVLTSIGPNSATTGSAALTMTVAGTNFVSTSTVDWNGTALVTTYRGATSLTAQVTASDLASGGTGVVTVVNPAPGGGTSGAANFTVNAAGSSAQIVVATLANSLAWDPVNQVIYLSLPSVDGSNGNSVQVLNPVTGQLGASAFAGSEPDLLAVSSSSKYLYVSLSGASNVQRMTLPGLGTDIKIGLGADSFFGPFYGLDLQASPVADGTVAVVRGTPGVSPEEEGGVVIYDDGVARSVVLCGWTESGCSGGIGGLYGSIQWNSTATEMFASNNEDTGYDFYTIPVSATGFGSVTDYGGLAGGFGQNIHFDKTTGYVYDDNGSIIDPAAGAKVGTFAASGLMVPDGANGKAYFLGQGSSSYGSSTYTIESFDINKFVPISTITVTNVVGTPTHLIRWGTNGLAFTTMNDVYGGTDTGAVYIISGSIVTQPASDRSNPPAENVQRSWPMRAPVARMANPADEVRKMSAAQR